MQISISTIAAFFSNSLEWLKMNHEGIIVGVVATICFEVLRRLFLSLIKRPKEIVARIKNDSFNDIDDGKLLVKKLRIKETMKRNFPEYSDFLLVQYGSSVDANNPFPQDYDYIVLMLGFPKEGRRYLHNKGTTGYDDISSKDNRYDVDIVYRDYLSFLYAATAGMPYENSVIANGEVRFGHKGYFHWLKNITKNSLYDRDYLKRRFIEKITAEREEYQKCINEHKKYGLDMYYVIRAGYYLITSYLQLKHINSFEKVFFQNDVIGLSKVRSFINDFTDVALQSKYKILVECLKRNNSVNDISIADIDSLLETVQTWEVANV